jgi:hypothetical protein
MAPSCQDATSYPHHPLRMALTAHDEEPAPPAEPAPSEPTPAPEPASAPPAPGPEAGADPEIPPGVRDAGQKAITVEREKRKAATAEAQQAKAALIAAQAKLQEFEDAKRSDLEKAQAAADRAQAREMAANRRAVTSDIRSAAIAADALDPTDLVDALAGRTDDFIKDGVIDDGAIEAAVADLLERKKHWKKTAAASPAPAAAPRPQPQPDPGQGPRGVPAPVDFTKAPREAVDAELAGMGIRRRS